LPQRNPRIPPGAPFSATEVNLTMSLQALARHFHDDLQTRTLLLAQMLEQPELAVLASRDFDGNLPGCDPREAITLDLLSKAAARLQKTEEEVRELYEHLAGEVPLTFS
jgi:hypothetical protein